MEKSQDYVKEVPMFSKIGRYISNKILKYSKSQAKKTKKTSFPQPNLQTKTQITKRANLNPLKSKIDFQPPVGSYKVNYSPISKNIHTYNFDRSTPHFYNQKYQGYEISTFYKQIPDTFDQKLKGFNQMSKMLGREDMKGSIRKFAEDPHENRFLLRQNKSEHKQCIDLSKLLQRDQKMFKNAQFSPDYIANFEFGKKRLDTHLLPFNKYLQRNQQYLYTPLGISDSFKTYKPQQSPHSIKWKKSLNKQNSSLVPSYLDKSISSRLALTQTMLKTLQMNCTNLKVEKQKNNPIKKVKTIQLKQN